MKSVERQPLILDRAQSKQNLSYARKNQTQSGDPDSQNSEWLRDMKLDSYIMTSTNKMEDEQAYDAPRVYEMNMK